MAPEYQMVQIGRLDGDDSPNYEVLALPEGKDFRDPDSFDRYTASWLKVNGVGFSADGAEFSEHDHPVTVDQDTDGGSLHIGL